MALVKFCSKCTYPSSHPLKLTFDNHNLCSGCLIHLEKDKIDWKVRFDKLKKIVKPYKSIKNYYNCIVPITGGRDSYFILDVVKHKLGLNPMLVNYNTHFNTEIGFRNLNYLRSIFGVPYINLTLDPNKIKKIVGFTLKEFGNIYWHCIAGQTVFPIQTAVKLNIPLIIWGAHQGIDQVGMYSHLDEVEMSRRHRKNHDLFNLEAEDILKKSTLSKNDLEPFFYPSDKSIVNLEVRGIYLNNYIRWDSKAQNEMMIKKFGYETCNLNRTFDSYQDVDSLYYSSIHDYFKYIKNGYSLVSDHANREIRLARLSRKDALHLIKFYKDRSVSNERAFIKWLDIDKKKLNYFYEKFRNTDIWYKNNNKWLLKKDLTENIKTDHLYKSRIKKILKNLNFNNNSRRTNKKIEKIPLLYSKGFD